MSFPWQFFEAGLAIFAIYTRPPPAGLRTNRPGQSPVLNQCLWLGPLGCAPAGWAATIPSSNLILCWPAFFQLILTRDSARFISETADLSWAQVSFSKPLTSESPDSGAGIRRFTFGSWASSAEYPRLVTQVSQALVSPCEKQGQAWLWLLWGLDVTAHIKCPAQGLFQGNFSAMWLSALLLLLLFHLTRGRAGVRTEGPLTLKYLLLATC